MASITTRQMTVEEFRQLPETEPFYYELRHGELVKVTRPKSKHFRLQSRLRKLLEAVAGNLGIVETEFPFRAIPEYDLRVADVAYLSSERWEAIDLEDNLQGAPDLVIEVVSPSNTVAELADKKALCLEHGCREFWVVHPDRRSVEVSTPDGITKAYRAGQAIPLPLFNDRSLDIDAIFA